MIHGESHRSSGCKACCADLYQSDLAYLLFGDTLHPGGLGLTNRLARMMDIQPGQWIADLASGGGASALAVSRVFRCNVIGVEFGALSVAKAMKTSRATQGEGRAFFVQGDAEYIPFRPGRFDGVLCECSMSLFSNKAAVVEQAVQLLNPGGVFGLSDVTLTPGTLPPELDGALGQLLCLPDALDVQGYADLLTNGGLEVVRQYDASREVVDIIDNAESRLAAFRAWQAITRREATGFDFLDQAPRVMQMLRQMVERGDLGYWLFVARKPVGVK